MGIPPPPTVRPDNAVSKTGKEDGSWPRPRGHCTIQHTAPRPALPLGDGHGLPRAMHRAAPRSSPLWVRPELPVLVPGLHTLPTACPLMPRSCRGGAYARSAYLVGQVFLAT